MPTTKTPLSPSSYGDTERLVVDFLTSRLGVKNPQILTRTIIYDDDARYYYSLRMFLPEYRKNFTVGIVTTRIKTQVDQAEMFYQNVLAKLGMFLYMSYDLDELSPLALVYFGWYIEDNRNLQVLYEHHKEVYNELYNKSIIGFIGGANTVFILSVSKFIRVMFKQYKYELMEGMVDHLSM